MFSELVFGDNSDKRFYGIYRGICVNSNDPINRGRVTLQVPQILGSVVTDWAWPITGGIGQIGVPYGTFITTANQSITQNTAVIVSNWQAEDTNRTYLTGDKIYVEETGDYFFQFSITFAKSNASTGQADVWIRKNGVDIDNSNTTTHVNGSDAEVIVTVGFVIDLDAGDYIELVTSTPDTNVVVKYHAPGVTPTRPAVPGVIATINLIGKYKPQPGTPVWVMFEGGDPNFPLWIGDF